ncbi:hypothetical protein [Pedobacter glucosidilyticus]|uniref:hypothetical protein n=1 Tax=Pedobacter glucosidilyticus TaxID=1122941 RepID=UPI0004064E59|nr:hypothetical protein [Pedobacter glucosidilyticus]
MNKIKLVLLSFFLFCQVSISLAQTTIPLKDILEKTAKYYQTYPSEKVHLHFDKPYYAVGDTIWFKAYVALEQHIPSPLSKILHVELINAKDSLVESLKLPVKNSVTQGSIVLNYLAYKQGNYRIRAYTKWMLNQNQAYLFTKNIVIGDAINKNLNTNITYKGTVTDKAIKVNSRIQFKDDRGMPIINKKVSWEVMADFERVAKGRETTDDKGFVNIEINTSPKVGINRGELFTTVEISSNTSYKASFPLKTALLEHDIQFFPEGGDLIDGIPTQVAFKAIKSDGLGINSKGVIMDESGKEIAQFTSQHLGMGAFSFVPELNKKYQAKVTFADGNQKTIPLPEVKAEGMRIALKTIDENLVLKIYANQKYVDKNLNKAFYIVAKSAGVIYYAAQSDLKSTVFTGQIPKNKFPTGILQVTLFSSIGEPLSERLIFLKRNDDLKINLSTDLQAYNSRQKVKVNITNSGGTELAEGSFSVAVIDETKVPADEDTETTIYSNLLLTSNLEGYIEKPNYYFNKMDDQKLAHLDLLMLTQGYRRFSYKDIIADKAPNLTFLPEQGIDITGTIRKSNGMPLDKGRLLLQIPEKYYSTTTTTDAEGKFKFSNMVFKDSAEVIVNARNNLNSKDLRIHVDGEAFPAIYANVNAADDILNIDSTLNTYLRNSKMINNNSLMLREVVIKSTATTKKSHLDFPALSGLNMMADRTTTGDQLIGCGLLVNCLSASGLTFVDNNLFITRTYNQGIRIPVEIYVNDMPVDIAYLNSLDAKGIESVQVFNNDGLSGINRRSNTSGVLVIIMKEIKKVPATKAQIQELFAPTNVITIKPKGYAVERQFYQPKYTGPRTSLQAQDIRSTIYWNPYINTDKEGKASFEFFNSDDKGPRKIVVEGMDKNGNFGRSIYRYQVK